VDDPNSNDPWRLRHPHKQNARSVEGQHSSRNPSGRNRRNVRRSSNAAVHLHVSQDLFSNDRKLSA